MKSLIAALSVFALSATVSAGETKESAHDMVFKALDKDQNGTVEMKEATDKGLTEEVFKKLDADSDGKLTAEEFASLTKEDANGLLG